MVDNANQTGDQRAGGTGTKLLAWAAFLALCGLFGILLLVVPQFEGTVRTSVVDLPFFTKLAFAASRATRGAAGLIPWISLLLVGGVLIVRAAQEGSWRPLLAVFLIASLLDGGALLALQLSQ